VCRGGQQRKLKQEQRQHDIAKIDRCCNRILTEADEEIDPHNAKRKHAPRHQSVDFDRVVFPPQSVQRQRRQPHDRATEKIIALDELKLRGIGDVGRKD